MPKRVLLVVIDALATRTVLPAIAEGRLPQFAELIERGRIVERCTSIFPSITPAATASIVTGKTPQEHGIAGAYWYDSQREKVAYYGSDLWVILKKNVGEYFHEFLVSLNFERLKSETLYEMVARKSRTAACVNYMWFRGDQPHEVNAPLLLKLLPGVSFEDSIRGPTHLWLADFVADALDGETPEARGGASRRFGFHDETTTDYLLRLAAHGLPDFTLAYFPNNDFDSHERGSQAAIETVVEVDGALGELFSQSGGIDKFLEQTAVIILGDHSQSDLNEGKPAKRRIALDEILSDYSLAGDGAWHEGEELMICPNMRAVQFYFRRPSPSARRQLVEWLLAEQNLDQVLWQEANENDSSMHGSHFHVQTADRGELEFWTGDDGPQSAADQRGNVWSWRGDLSALDASQSGGRLEFGTYPDALHRVATSFTPESGDVWATSRLGYEFQAGSTSVHPAGSHGSLHELDSTTPVIIGGPPADLQLPDRLMLTDIAPLCLELMSASEDHEKD